MKKWKSIWAVNAVGHIPFFGKYKKALYVSARQNKKIDNIANVEKTERKWTFLENVRTIGKVIE